MTRDRLELMLQHCADLAIDVEWEDLGSTRRGEYRWEADTIVLSPRLTDAQAVSTLAHEIGHRLFGDTHSSPANERRAWQYAAAMLISPWEYRFAEALVGHHLSALARELGVTPRLIEGWRDWWQVRGHLGEWPNGEHEELDL